MGHRYSTLTWEPSPFDESRMSKKMMKMERANFWKRVDPTGPGTGSEPRRGRTSKEGNRQEDAGTIPGFRSVEGRILL